MMGRSVRERYESDAHYRQLTDSIESMLHQAHFTPSEVREAAMQACINYEMRRPRVSMVMNEEKLAEAMQILDSIS